jgi:hypothetical protein
MTFKKMMKNPWLILGGAVAVYWFWLRPKGVGTLIETEAQKSARLQREQQDRLNKQIHEVMTPLPGEAPQDYESRMRAYEMATGQIMPTMNI